MFAFLKIRASAVKNIGNSQVYSDQFWDSVMQRSRSIQEEAAPQRGYNRDSLRTGIDTINRGIVEVVALRMKLFQDQVIIPGYGISQIHTRTDSNYNRIFDALDNLCMTTRTQAKVPAGQSGW